MERLTKLVRLQEAWKPSDLLRLLQDVASEDAARRGGGQAELLRRGFTWVLVKNRLSISRWPDASEELRLSTWPIRGRFALYPRCFSLADSSGEELIGVESIWAIMDLESRSMISGESRGIQLIGAEAERFRPPHRISVPEGGENWLLEPTPEQIDDNGHMNNAAYLDAVEPMLPADLRLRRPLAIAIDYEHELLPGRCASVRVLRAGDSCYFEGSMEDKICFRLREDFAV